MMTSSELLKKDCASAGLVAKFPSFRQLTSENLAQQFASHPYLMAPMAGVSNAAWRLMARAGGTALAWSEMVSASGIVHGSAKTLELALPDAAEGMLAVQLFGSKPAEMQRAAAVVAERLGGQLALIDINMACPVAKVVKKGEGSALLDDPERAAELVGACRREVEVPVTVKIRIGRTPERIVGPAFAQEMEQAGAAAVAVHGRCASEFYHGQARWDEVGRVVHSVAIPVIGSGDVTCAERACELRRQTGACAVFVARGSYGNPWIFRDAEMLDSGAQPPEHTLAERIAAYELHIRLLEATGAHMLAARPLAGWYFKGLSGATSIRRASMEASSAADFLALADEIKARAEAQEVARG